MRVTTNRSPENTRQRILDAAFDEFYRNGFQGGSLNRIVDDAATTKGALFHHFKGKKRFSAESGGVHRGSASGHSRYGQKHPERGVAVANEPCSFRLSGQLETLGILFYASYHTDQSVCYNFNRQQLQIKETTKLKMKTKLQLSKNVTQNKPDEKRQGMQVRAVVTGHDAKGRAVFVRDEQVDGMPIPGLGELAFLWNADEPATYPNAGNNPGAPGIFPPVGGIRFIMSTYLPGGVVAPEPTPEMHIEDGDELGGANAGFHRTDTTDFGVVLSGNLALQLDDGAEVSLAPGDVLIENGTRHRWRVVGNVSATMASFIIGAHRH